MTNELDEIRHLLEEFAMSIYPHGKTPVWNSVSDGVKDLIDYAKSLDDTEHRRRCRMSIDICPDFGDIVSELTAENEKLTARIAELGLELGRKSVELGELVGENILWKVINDELKSCRENLERENDRLQDKVSDLLKRIAELEGKIDQLTAHSDIERQDDKWIPEVI
jgi:predicted RNase H-like nuclease (RuvC/YqgF family)